MFLIADSTKGIQMINNINIPNKMFKFLNNEDFYENLDYLKDGEIIITTSNLSFCKKIHKEYGIRGIIK